MKNIRIEIPEPCSENWNSMTVVDDQHRHCASCEKVLTDFSGMTDDELMIFFKQNKGKVCGRFSATQINRPLQLIPEQKIRRSWWKAAALIPLSFFASKASGQATDTTSRKFPRKELTDKPIIDPVLLPAKDTVSQSATTQKIILTGTVLDQANSEPLPFAIVTVMLPGEKDSVLTGASTDIDGNYRITIEPSLLRTGFRIKAMYVGYNSKMIVFHSSPVIPAKLDLTLEVSETMILGEYIIPIDPASEGRMGSFWNKIRLSFSSK